MFNRDRWNEILEALNANKLEKILFLDIENVRKYRPLEINFDNLRVSFDKGCFRGQEIVARMKYLGINRRKFSTLITKNTYKADKALKIIGKKIQTDKLQIFNAIIKRDEIDSIKNQDSVIDII